ncbi:ABC transporter ATP-binding protein [bacterium]|nr:ABC transporter ATP-binding protein [bacterium]
MVKLQISNLSHEYDDREVLHDINFTFDGARMAITGPNGSGKSTLTRIIAGLLTPTVGQVSLEIDGVHVSRECVRDIVGLVAPDIRLYGELTVRENLKFIASARGLGSTKINAVLDEVNITDRADDMVKNLSSGLQRRACYAAALIHDPTVLLLDEPSTNLDKKGIEMVRDMVDRRAKRGIVVLATNDADEAAMCESYVDLSEVAR